MSCNIILINIILVFLVGLSACASPTTPTPTHTTTATSQPTASPTIVPSSTPTPEATVPAEAVVIEDGLLSRWNSEMGRYEPIFSHDAGTSIFVDEIKVYDLLQTELKVTAFLFNGIPQAIYDGETGDLAVLVNGEAKVDGRLWHWDEEHKEMVLWVELNPIVPGRTVFGSQGMTYGLELSDAQSEALHQKLETMFGTAIELKVYREAFVGKDNPTLDEFRARLETSFGPNGEPKWLPGEVIHPRLGVIQLEVLQSNHSMMPYAKFGSNPAVEAGISLAGSRLVVYDPKTYLVLDAYLRAMRVANVGPRGSLIGQLGRGEMGLLVNPKDHTLLWVSATQASPKEGMNREAYTHLLGPADRCFVPQIVSAQMATYEKLFETHTDKDKNVKICLNTPKSSGGCTGYVFPEDILPEAVWVNLSPNEAAACQVK